MALIPATILTGFLGSGKTTLLKRILTEAHGQKIAVIENEFGEENIDSDILVTESKEQIVQMSNGCVCCTIREDLREALQLLAAKKRQGLLSTRRSSSTTARKRAGRWASPTRSSSARATWSPPRRPTR